MTNLIRVMTKAYKHLGADYPAKATEHQVRCTGVSKTGYNSITIFRDDRHGVNPPMEGSTFMVGDICEEDSYNLSYHGTILKITDKTVTIKPKLSNKLKRMALHEFCWRNFNFNLSKSIAENVETSYSI